MKQEKAFTLAEVLITLGIIGVVAAMTLPALIQNYQKKVLQNQFKKTYSMIQQAWKKSEYDLGLNPATCFYWESNPYGSAKYEFDDEGNATSVTLANGDPLPGDYNGLFDDCTVVWNKMIANMHVIKSCPNKAREKGCIPDYKGLDDVKTTANPDISSADLKKAMAGCGNWSKTNLDNNYDAYVLKDGTILLGILKGRTFAVDVNGMKGPNQWGYDLFGLAPTGTYKRGIRFKSSSCDVTEAGGFTTNQMILK